MPATIPYDAVVEKPAFYAQVVFADGVHQSLRQRKLSTVLLWYAARQGVMEQEKYHAPVQDLCRVLNIKDAESLSQAFTQLQDVFVQTKIIDEAGSFEWERFNLVSWARIADDLAGWAYSPGLRDRLALPDNIANIELEKLRRFRTLAGLALYENLLLIEHGGATDWFEWEHLADILCVKVGNVGQTSFRVFNARYLKPAVEEVKEIVGWDVGIEPRRTGRTVSHVRLAIVQQQQHQGCFELEDAEPKINEILAMRLVDDYGQSEDAARGFVSTMEESVILRTLEDVDLRVSKKTIIPSRVGAYVFKVLKTGGVRETKAERDRRMAERTEKSRAVARIKEMQRKAAFDDYRAKLAQERWNYTSSETQERFLSEFLASDLLAKTYKPKRDAQGALELTGPFAAWARNRLLTAAENDEANFAVSTGKR